MDVDHSLNLTSLTVDNCLRVFKIFLDSFLAINLHYFFTLSITYQNSAVRRQIFTIHASPKKFYHSKIANWWGIQKKYCKNKSL